MIRIQFIPSNDLDKRMSEAASRLGISKGMLASKVLESIHDFDQFLDDLTNPPQNDVLSLADRIVQDMEHFAEANPEREFILNDLNSYRAIQLSMRPILGKTIFNRIYQGDSDVIKIVTVPDSEGRLVVKKKQRAVLYSFCCREGGEKNEFLSSAARDN